MNKIQVYTINKLFLTEEVPVRFYEFLNTENITARIIVIKIYIYRVRVIVFNTTFNNISVISWCSVLVLLVEETRVPGENHWPATSHWQTLSHNVVLSTQNLVMIGTDCIGSCKSNWSSSKKYHTRVLKSYFFNALMLSSVSKRWWFQT